MEGNDDSVEATLQKIAQLATFDNPNKFERLGVEQYPCLEKIDYIYVSKEPLRQLYGNVARKIEMKKRGGEQYQLRLLKSKSKGEKIEDSNEYIYISSSSESRKDSESGRELDNNAEYSFVKDNNNKDESNNPENYCIICSYPFSHSLTLKEKLEHTNNCLDRIKLNH